MLLALLKYKMVIATNIIYLYNLYVYFQNVFDIVVQAENEYLLDLRKTKV